MTIDTIEPNKQLYTLLVTHCDSKQTVIAQHGSTGAILTTDHAALMEYTRLQVLHFGTRRIYTVSTVSPMTVFADGTTSGKIVGYVQYHHAHKDDCPCVDCT